MDARVEQVHEQLRHRGVGSRRARGDAMRAHQHQCPYHVGRQWRPHADTVTGDEMDLEGAELLGRNTDRPVRP